VGSLFVVVSSTFNLVIIAHVTFVQWTK